MRFTQLALVVSTVALVIGCKKDPLGDRSSASSVDSAPIRASTIPGARIVPLSPDKGTIAFTGAKVTASQDGSFKDFSGKVQLVDGALEKSLVDMNIVIASLQVEPEMLKQHLLSDDFLGAAKFPSATFVSTKLSTSSGESTHLITGVLTLRGRSKAITFPIDIKLNGRHLIVDADFLFNRQDFGVKFPGSPDDLISDKVRIKLHFDCPLEGTDAPAPK